MIPRLSALVVLVPLFAFAQPQPDTAATQAQWHRLVGILQYLQGDYRAAVESKSELELTEQREFAKDAVEIVRGLGPSAVGFKARIESLQKRVNASSDIEGVTADAAVLVEDLVRAGGLARSPKVTPELAKFDSLYQSNCAACHGADGRAQTPIAATLDPKPANFHDDQLMSALTPYKAFNTTTFGIKGTGMAGFPHLSEADRWALAFGLFTLRQPPCDHVPPKASLEQLANATDTQVAEIYGEQEVACLRRVLPKADEEGALFVARSGIEEAMKLGAAGDAAGAKAALLDAYLNGLEPVEPLLRARDGALVQKLEERFLAARLAAEQQSPRLQDEGRTLLSLIDQARKTRGTTSALTVFLQAILIILREGFEASVILAALLAVLKKMKQEQYAKVVHAGWISALIVGAAVYFFAQKLIAGANREWMEGIVALAAVGMLLYAALWLNARSNTSKWMKQLRSDMQGALGRGSVAGLFFISFTAVGRETLETALFLQGLSIDSPTGAMWGAVAGCVALVGLVLFVNRVGYVLPMKTLFTASTVILVATAVMLLGKGLHAIQEVGALPLSPIPMFQASFLGIFPDAVSLVPQLLLSVAAAVYFWARQRTAKQPPPGTGVGTTDHARASPE